ncbi:hypothetical protein HanXRQr2_Chr11g0503451 [Helianthus annuus]|uniref:Uncharacterized protein n=1 Tax=Helianthus annuus TaxID=4232 RepID=A0A9K3N123_HELAN|nr:hypothetical protein HanXRQr2_Chr11g0503451 [Helianthus annuus]
MSALMLYFKLIVDVFEALYKRFPVSLYDCITNPIQHKSRKDGLSRVEEASVATTGFPRYSSGTKKEEGASHSKLQASQDHGKFHV